MPTPEGPPPPPAKNTRKHPRFEMYASVELRAEADDEAMILPARNISLGGVYVDADGHDLGGFPDGTELDVMVFDALDETHRPVRLHAVVMRHDGAGMALMWSSSESNAALELARLLDAMKLK